MRLPPFRSALAVAALAALPAVAATDRGIACTTCHAPHPKEGTLQKAIRYAGFV